MSKNGQTLFSQSESEIIEFKLEDDMVFEGHEGFVNNILVGKSYEKL